MCTPPVTEYALQEVGIPEHGNQFLEFVVKFVENVPPEHFQGFGFLIHREKESGLVRSPSKSCRFSHPYLRALKA